MYAAGSSDSSGTPKDDVFYLRETGDLPGPNPLGFTGLGCISDIHVVGQTAYVADGCKGDVVERQITSPMPQQSTVELSGLQTPDGIDSDSSGDLFVSDSGADDVVELPADGSGQTTVLSNLDAPQDLAVDPAGDVYVSEANGDVIERLAGGSVETVVTGLDEPGDLDVDAFGDVYVVNAGANDVVEVVAGSHTAQVLPGLTGAAGIAVASDPPPTVSRPTVAASATLANTALVSFTSTTGADTVGYFVDYEVAGMHDTFTHEDEECISDEDDGGDPPPLLVSDLTPNRSYRFVAIVCNSAGVTVSAPSAPFTIHPPTIMATARSRHAKTRFRWYRSRVTIRYTCSPGTGVYRASGCPPTVTDRKSGVRVIRAHVTDRDGTTAISKVVIRLDRAAPTLHVYRALNGTRHHGLRCVASDRLSGLAHACTITTRRHGDEVSYVAKATDRAGNRTTRRGSVRADDDAAQVRPL